MPELDWTGTKGDRGYCESFILHEYRGCASEDEQNIIE